MKGKTMSVKGTKTRTWGVRALVGATIAATAVMSSMVTAAAAGGEALAVVSTQAPTKAARTSVAIESGATWAWHYSAQTLPENWNTAEFDADGWATGPALLGRGVVAETTDIDLTSLSAKPISAQFRKTFTVTGAAKVKDGSVTVIADDGVVVYLNGVELGRANMPDGPLTQYSLATAAPRAAVAAKHAFTFLVPAKLLQEGTNVVAASVHANTPTTRDMSYDLALRMPR
jgi:hypothetical protein